jgi:catechol 2,3-dioxygenase-like lactoylglutathione lyase family enzyme
VIIGAHTIVYSKDTEATRTFFSDVLGLASVDAGGGWLIFGLPPSELAAHPTEEHLRHELYFMCDDIHSTVAELESRGAMFTRPVSDEGWGLITALEVPGGGQLGLYEPRHARPSVPG